MVHPSTKTHKSGKPLRVEPYYNEVFEAFPEVGKIFADAKWLNLCRRLKGFHAQVAMAFADIFNGYQAQVGGL